MDIRQLGPGDRALLGSAMRAFRGFEHPVDHACLSDPGALAFVAMDGETVTGWAFGHELPHPVGPPSLVLYELDVARAARGGGVGRALLDAFTVAAHARDLDAMWMMTDVEGLVAQRLHPGAGARPRDRAGSWWIFG